MALPIKKRGNFFKDEFFQDSHNDFDNAMDKVMDKFGGRSILADQFTNYRKLRRGNSDLASAASISDTGDNYIIVLDMSDFLSGSITVSTTGKNAVVEANFEKKIFYKKFPLPSNSNIDGVKSAMSDEGILTINAPKKVSGRVAASVLGDTVETDIAANSKEEQANETKEGKITIECLNLTNKIDDGTSQSSPPLTPSETRRISIDRRGNFFQDSTFKNIWSDFEKSMEDMIQKEKSNRAQRETAKAERRAHRDAVFEKLTKQFFEDVSPRRKDTFFEKDSKKQKEKLFDSEKCKHRSFEDDINSIKEKYFGENSPKRKDAFFDEEFSKSKEDFFGDDFTRRKDNFFKDDSTRKKDKFFEEDSSRRRDKFFEDDSKKRRDKFFENTSKRRDPLFEDDLTRKKDNVFEDDLNKIRDRFFGEDETSKKHNYFEDDSAKRNEKYFEEDADFGFFTKDNDKMARFKKYRNLRKWDPEADTQAVSVKQSSDSYKILLDAKDVDSSSLSVQAKDDGLLVSGGEGRNAFKRKFSLPGAISFDKVNANLSEDGILIITIPKN